MQIVKREVIATYSKSFTETYELLNRRYCHYGRMTFLTAVSAVLAVGEYKNVSRTLTKYEHHKLTILTYYSISALTDRFASNTSKHYMIYPSSPPMPDT